MLNKELALQISITGQPPKDARWQMGLDVSPTARMEKPARDHDVLWIACIRIAGREKGRSKKANWWYSRNGTRRSISSPTDSGKLRLHIYERRRLAARSNADSGVLRNSCVSKVG